MVSIITPMYKGAEFVAATIESVINQTEQDWEMIIVDDCSPDNGASAAIVKQYAEKDTRIKLIQLRENRGSSGARNEAMRHAQGRYFAFLDSDDIWDADYLSTMLMHIASNKNKNAAIFFSGYRRMDSICSKEILPPYKYSGIKNNHTILFNCPIFPSATILDTSKLKEKILFREELRNLRDDWVFWTDIMRQDLVAVGHKDILVNYRMRDNSLTSSKNKMIKATWNMYHNIFKINTFISFIYLFLWAVNGVIKYRRIR
ncbi:glycosyl transferase [Spirochaetia bacterium]|nr:glycosyl transferase [Spirochaetia bacterium]